MSDRPVPVTPDSPEQSAAAAPGAQRVRRVSGSRRAILTPVPGTDPNPQASREPVVASEDSDRSWGGRPTPTGTAGGNDAQLLADVPPHWG